MKHLIMYTKIYKIKDTLNLKGEGMNKIIIKSDSVIVDTATSQIVRNGIFLEKDIKIHAVNCFLYEDVKPDEKIIEILLENIDKKYSANIKDKIEQEFILICNDGIAYANIKYPDKITDLEIYRGNIQYL